LPTASALTLQTIVSMPPSSAAASSTHCFSATGSATSIALPHAFTPVVAINFTTPSTWLELRAQIATLAPSAANSSAMARPASTAKAYGGLSRSAQRLLDQMMKA
jgi:hypothetical protein